MNPVRLHLTRSTQGCVYTCYKSKSISLCLITNASPLALKLFVFVKVALTVVVADEEATDSELLAVLLAAVGDKLKDVALATLLLLSLLLFELSLVGSVVISKRSWLS